MPPGWSIDLAGRVVVPEARSAGGSSTSLRALRNWRHREDAAGTSVGERRTRRVAGPRPALPATITQRSHERTSAVLVDARRTSRTTTPLLPLEFCFRPITLDSHASVSPAYTGSRKRTSA
jgi:hypothetical protein